MLEAVRAQVAIVLGGDSPEAIESRRAFKELGVDSRAAMEIRNRLRVLTWLRLSPTLLFDHPTPASLADYLLREFSGEQAEVFKPSITVAQVDEPIAIVGMSCRYPGGVSSPEDLWELVALGLRCDRRVPRRSRLGCRAPLRPRSRSTRHELQPPWWLSL